MNTTEKKREEFAHAAMVAPELSQLHLRPISAGSLAILQLVGSPIYEVLFHGREQELTLIDLLIFAFCHTAAPEQLRDLATRPEELRAAAIAAAESYPPSYSVQVSRELTQQLRSIVSQFSHVLPQESPEKSKNVPGQPS